MTRRESEEEEGQRVLLAAPLRLRSPSPELQPAGPMSSLDKETEADIQPKFEREDMMGTSFFAEDGNMYMTPDTTPPPEFEGEDGIQTPPGALSLVDDRQLRVSRKRKVETMELDMDLSTEYPALKKKARTDSGHSSMGEDDYRWNNIPPPKDTDRRLTSRFPWGNETLVMGKPFSEFSFSEDLSRGRRAEKSDCATIGGNPISGGSTGGGTCAGEEESLYSAASDLTQVMTSSSPDQSQPAMIGARPKGSSCSVDSRHSDFASPPRKEATEPYRTFAGRMMLDRADWTHYAQQDEARPGALHLEWPESLRTVGSIRISAGSEGTFRQEHAKPHAPTFPGRVLWRKHGIKAPKSWGNAQERPAIRRIMKEAATAFSDDRDWFAPTFQLGSSCSL